VAHGDIFPLNAAREPFFVKMWPAYETEFETPDLEASLFTISGTKGPKKLNTPHELKKLPTPAIICL